MTHGGGDDAVASSVLSRLAEHGVTDAVGVPCSLLAGLFRALEAGPDAAAGIRYTAAPREDSALGVASGLAVAGARPVVLMQNSGLGYSLNVLTSFNLIYKVPLLLVLSWRGRPGHDDAIEHDVIGAKLLDLLDLFGIGHEVLDHDDPERSVDRVVARLGVAQRPAALVVDRAT